MENIEVAIRIRPFLPNEIPSSSTIKTDEEDDRKISVLKEHDFFEAYYDKIFFPSSTQESLFSFISPAINKSMKSFINCTIMAYGQTGSGKTFTMFGSDWTAKPSISSPYENYVLHTENLPLSRRHNKYDFITKTLPLGPFSPDNGLVPRIMQSIFGKNKSEYKVVCSYIQIYNEQIYDLLSNSHDEMQPKPRIKAKFDLTSSIRNHNNRTINPMNQKALSIREDKDWGIIIKGVMEYEIDVFYDCFALLKEGETNRKKRQTNKNELSSRSHSIFMISLIKENDQGEITHRSKINLCDLAGSEKYDNKESYNQFHFNELININLSLATLGNVIHALTNKSQHIPYRNSKLTKILQDSLGGNTKTHIIATISPTVQNVEETISTLKFADRAHSVFCKVEPNEKSLGTKRSDDLIKKLTSELSELKEVMKRRKRFGKDESYNEEMFRLKEENEELKMYVMSNEPLKKLINENKLLKSEIKKMAISQPWTLMTTSYQDNSMLAQNENNYNGLASAGKNVVNTDYGYGYEERSYQKTLSNTKVDSIKGKIAHTKYKLNRLDEIEKESREKTKKMIDDIINNSKKKKENY